MTRIHIVLGVVIAALLAVGLLGVRGCRDGKQEAQAIVMAERLRSDSVIHLADSVALVRTNVMLNEAMTRGTQVVEHWNTVKVPVAIPASATPHDTIASVSKRLSACYVAGDSLVQSVVKIQTACSAFRDTATKTIRNQRVAYAHLDSLLKIGKHPKRWAVGPYVGYGLHQDKDWAIQRGFSAGIGIHYNIISW